jgi:hypothetical protein
MSRSRSGKAGDIENGSGSRAAVLFDFFPEHPYGPSVLAISNTRNMTAMSRKKVADNVNESGRIGSSIRNMTVVAPVPVGIRLKDAY